jgi:polyisoprenoid-binding protein YceI
MEIYRMKALALALCIVLFVPPGHRALAQQQKFTLDPEKTTVSFTLGAHDGEKHGTFHAQSGSIDFDRTARTISGSIIVAAATGDSGSSSRDKKMTKDVLDASKFAEISFSPKTYQGTIAATGDSTIQVTGIFHLHGSAHEITVPVQIHIDGTNCSAKARFPVPYVAWGLKDPSFLMFTVAKEVGIDLTLAGHLSN